MSSSQQATFELRQQYRTRNDLLLLAATYWTLGGQPHKVNPAIQQERMGHACEFETSMILRIAPHLVRQHEQTQSVEFGVGFEPAARAWVTQDRSTPGHIGDPRIATAEKGEVIFETFSADVVTLLNRMIAWDGKSWNG
ncbi:MAG: creatininase family protein [Planctomycetales bacterium]